MDRHQESLPEQPMRFRLGLHHHEELRSFPWCDTGEPDGTEGRGRRLRFERHEVREFAVNFTPQGEYGIYGRVKDVILP